MQNEEIVGEIQEEKVTEDSNDSQISDAVDAVTVSDTEDIQQDELPILQDHDMNIQILSYLANYLFGGTPVLLTIGGTLVSGQLISKEKFNEYYLEMLQGITSSLDSENIKQAIKNIEKMIEPLPDEKIVRADQHRYIHLKNVQILNGGNNPVKGGNTELLWRGKISSIDGFSFGELSRSEE